MRPKVLRIRFWPLKEIAIYIPRCGPRISHPGRGPDPWSPSRRRWRPGAPSPQRGGRARYRRRERPGARVPSRPGSTISNFSAAPFGRRCALSKVVADLPYFDSRTRIFKLLLDFCCFFFVDPLLDRLWGCLDKILGFFQAEACDGAYFLNYVDLFLADRRQDDIEFGLFGRCLGRRRRAAASCRYRDGGRRRDAPLLFEHLGQLRRLDDGQGRQIVDESCQISHFV